MFTICPKCALTLVVTAADLRVAQGYVRCGRCSSVFNALARLTDERAAPAPSEPEVAPSATRGASGAAGPSGAADSSPNPSRPAAASPGPAVPASDAPIATDTPHAAETRPRPADEERIPEEALEFDPSRTDVTQLFVEPPPDPHWTAATGSFKALIAANSDVGPDVAITSDARSRQDTAAPTGAALAQQSARGAAAAAHVVTAADVPTTASGPTPADQASIADAAPIEPDPARTRARMLVHLWRAGAVLAALALAAQVVNHDRDELAANARFNRPLTALYAALGVALVPHWDLSAYDVRQLGATVSASGAGLITVRASVKNAASQPQPLPLLRVTLQDRFGNRIAARDVAPRFYLPHVMPQPRVLGVGQRIDAEMGFVDPGANAVGFEIDACLPASGGGVVCANEATNR